DHGGRLLRGQALRELQALDGPLVNGRVQGFRRSGSEPSDGCFYPVHAKIPFQAEGEVIPGHPASKATGQFVGQPRVRPSAGGRPPSRLPVGGNYQAAPVAINPWVPQSGLSDSLTGSAGPLRLFRLGGEDLADGLAEGEGQRLPFSSPARPTP